MFYRVPYTKIYEVHRPFLEVIFFSSDLSNSSKKTLALVDSGADDIVIPFSIGKTLGFLEPGDEEYKEAQGVGGQKISLIERDCTIYLVSPTRDSLYGFPEKVHWAYPSKVTQELQKQLERKFADLNTLKEDTKPGSKLEAYFQGEIEKVIQESQRLTSLYETSVLLGRCFFHNFEFLQFIHSNRGSGHTPHLNIRIRNSDKLIHIPLVDLDKGQAGSVKTGGKTKSR